MDDLDGFVTYDHLTIEPLRERGWAVDDVPWRAPAVDWDAYEAVVIRTPWDYQDDPEAFLDVLTRIDQSRARLENSLDLVRWNIDKTYLRDLEARGLRIVPTIWGQDLTDKRLAGLFDEARADQLVVKPTIGANADDTFWLRRRTDAGWAEAVQAFRHRPFMVQPFVPSVVEEGEFSLFYFAGRYSHAILKTPKAEDFRVQEEHGGHIQGVQPEPSLVQTGDAVMRAIAPAPLYARVDLVRLPEGRFAVMEVELIEPSLYFSYDAASPVRFAEAFAAWMGG